MPVFTGTNDDDFITGGGEDDVIQGLGGNDFLNGQEGENVVEGGEGDDSITSMSGIDIIDGGAGVDFLSFFRESSSVDLHIDLTSPGPVATGDGGSIAGMEYMNATGGAGDDIFVGGSLNDILSGRGGADHLDGGAGDDWIRDDESFIGAFDDTILGGAGDDMITSSGGSDAIDGGAGFDSVFLYRDTLSVALHVDLSILGSTPVDIGDGTTLAGIEQIGIIAGSGDDVFVGGAFTDTFNGGNGNDDLAGGAGDDSLLGQSGDDIVRGGDGDDTLQGRLVHGDDGDDEISGGSDLAATDMLFGDAGNDVIYGAGGANVMHGGAGDDQINGGFTSSNEIFGEDGNDLLDGGDGDDLIDGGAGNDSITYGDGVDELNGGDGIDSISLPLLFISQAAITFDIADADQGVITLDNGTTIADFERVNIHTSMGDDHISGGAFDDIVTAGQGDDVVHGGGGADIIRGEGGSDVLDGGAGNDQIEDFDDLNNPGVDAISGGDGNDSVFTMGNPGDVLDGGAGVDTLRLSFSGLGQALTLTLGDAAVAGIALSNFEIAFFTGTEFNDLLTGGALDDELWGQGGDDHLVGLSGDDLLWGRSGNDVLTGGDGNDLMFGDEQSFADQTTGTDQLFGGAGDDMLHGGPGADVLEGGDGNDTLTDVGDGGTLRGGAGDDVIQARPGDGWIVDGGTGFDTLEFDGSFNLAGTTLAGVERLFSKQLGATVSYAPGQLDGLSEILVWGVTFAPNAAGVTNLSAVNMPAQVPGAFTSLPASFDFDGTAGADMLIMPASGLAAVTASGFEGNDTLVGGGGDDTLIGGVGNDTLSGGGGDDSFTIDLTSGVDQFFGGVAGADSGFDTIDLSNASAAVIVQLSGYAVSAGGTLLATFSGLEGAVGSNFDDALIGNASANRLAGGGGNDWLVGFGGDDVFALAVDGGVDRVFGGDANADSGFDTVDFSFQNAGVIVDLSAGNATSKAGVLLALFTGIEGAAGGFGNDTLIGTAGDNRFAGGGGTDWIVGGDGDDWFAHDGDYVVGRPDSLFGDAGVDTLDHSLAFEGVVVDMSGQTANGVGILLANFFSIENAIGTRFDDTLIGDASANSLSGGEGDDRFVQSAATAVDVLAGGAGVDTLDYGAASAGIVVQLAGWSTLNGGALLATFTGVENAIGSSFNDALIGDSAGNRLTGGAGADWLVGAAGDDTFVQSIEAGAIDRLFGDAGVDTLDYSSAEAAVTVQLSGYATSGGATLATFTGIENAIGAAFNDVLVGNASNNVITGGAGDDWLVGGAGDDRFVQGVEAGIDRIFGDAGTDALDYSGASGGVIVQLSGYATVNGGALLATFTGIEDAIGSIHDDVLVGAASANRLTGGIGDDWLVGGAGADTFVYRAVDEGGDTIADFSRADLDKIDLSAIDADPTQIGDQSFAFSTARTSGLAGEAVATTFASSTLISLYLDTDNVADMVIQIIHQPGLVMNAGDFVL